MFRFLCKWFCCPCRRPPEPLNPIFMSAEEITVIKTTLKLVTNPASDFDKRDVSVDGVAVGTYTKAQLEDVDNPVLISFERDRLAVVALEQKDWDTSGNFSIKTFNYLVVDNVAPGDAPDPIVSAIEQLD